MAKKSTVKEEKKNEEIEGAQIENAENTTNDEVHTENGEEEEVKEMVEQIEKEVMEDIKNDETINKVNETISNMEENLNKINEKIITDKSGAEELINAELAKLDALEKELDAKQNDDGAKKLKSYFKTKTFSQFWNGISSGWDE